MFSHPFLRGLTPTLHIAHRGGSALAPENTLPAFRQAVERFRTDMLELDLHLSSDGELVVAHDSTLDRCTDLAGPLREFTYAQLARADAGFRFERDGSFPFRGQGIVLPRFVDVLRALPGLRINVELKPDNPGIELAFADLVRAERAVERVCCGSESDEQAARLFQALPDACHFFPREALTAFVLSIKGDVEPPVDERFTVLDMPLSYDGLRLVDETFRNAAKGHGKWINVWTIDDPAEMRELRRLRVGGIMTDRPDLLRQVLSEPL